MHTKMDVLGATKTCSSAAENGQFECLKYLHEKGCPWYEVTCSFAA